MNYFRSNSSICFLSSTNSTRAIRYGAIDTGSVPSTRSIENSTSLLGGSPSTSFRNTSSNSCTTCMSDFISSPSSFRCVKIMKHWASSCSSFITPWDDNNSGSFELRNNNFFSRQSIRMRLADNQSIPNITSSSCRGKQIRFTLYLRPSTSTGHLAHKDDVLN